MKKSTAKPAKSTAPAKATPAKIVKKPAAASAKPTAIAAKPASSPAKRATTPVTKAPAVKAGTEKKPSTVITALIDVGFGNALYLRGEGPSLSWDVGVAMDCVSDSKWSITLPGTGKPVIYKLLINDLTWSQGSDYIVESGSSVTVVPSF
jgi:hypothetical protein